MCMLQPSPQGEVKPGSETSRQHQAFHTFVTSPLCVTSTLAKHIPCTEAVLSHLYRMNPPPSLQQNGLWHPTGNSPWTVWAASEQKVAMLVMSQIISIAILSLLLGRSTVNVGLENSLGKKKKWR